MIKLPTISKKVLYVGGAIIAILAIHQLYRMMTREHYSPFDNFNGGVDNTYGPQIGLYQEDIGMIGTDKEFSHMRKPYLNPILVPVKPSL